MWWLIYENFWVGEQKKKQNTNKWLKNLQNLTIALYVYKKQIFWDKKYEYGNCNYLPLSNTSDEGKYNIKNTRLIPEAILTLRQISIVKYNFMVSKMSTTLSILSLFQIYKKSLTELSFAAHKHCYQPVSGVGFQMISMWFTIKKNLKNHNR